MFEYDDEFYNSHNVPMVVKDWICQHGCQFYTLFIKGNDFPTCPHCGTSIVYERVVEGG